MPRIPGLLTTYVLSSWRRAEDAAPAMAWVDETVARLRPHARPTYLNYLTDEAPGAIRAAYGASFARLRRVKRSYDPDNAFHRGRAIPPA
jgi:FAD/FMN-containing dehydrogenase